MTISEIQQASISYISENKHKSYDLFDALTNPLLNFVTNKRPLLRRIAIQINSKSPFDLHWLGMKRMVHTKTISDLLWFYSIGNHENKIEKIRFYYDWLVKLKNRNGYGWGLNFPYTSRFIDATSDMPNLYNTINSGLAFCYSYKFLNSNDRLNCEDIINGILSFLDTELGFVDEGAVGWYLYYPGQKHPTYNVNALALYFLSFVKKLGIELSPNLNRQRLKIISLLVKEQEIDGSWFYSRSPKGKWVDGFHSAFVIESIAFAVSNGEHSKEIVDCLERGWNFYITKMFTADGFPKYFANSGKYPIEAQNVAQSIQTLAVFGLWRGKDVKDLLNRNIENMQKNLIGNNGAVYHKKTKFWTFRQAYIRWSITPTILALEYAKQYLDLKKL